MEILVVEDEAEMRESIVQSLPEEQYVVEAAADYASALEKLDLYSYDCILLDIGLPGGSGLTLLKELKREATEGAAADADGPRNILWPHFIRIYW